MRKLFISTGGFKDLTPTQAIKKLNKNNIFNIELSGGKYEKNVGNKILRINNKNEMLNFVNKHLFERNIYYSKANYTVNSNKRDVKKTCDEILKILEKNGL